jgi:hypothetical protein
MNPDNVKDRSPEDDKLTISNMHLRQMGGNQGLANKLLSSIEVSNYLTV